MSLTAYIFSGEISTMVSPSLYKIQFADWNSHACVVLPFLPILQYHRISKLENVLALYVQSFNCIVEKTKRIWNLARLK